VLGNYPRGTDRRVSRKCFAAGASIETLKTQNTLLQQDLLRLQRQVDDQAGQLKIISQLMDTTLKERAERSGERAALRLIQTLIELKQDRPTDPS
jgi:hypothetical protein